MGAVLRNGSMVALAVAVATCEPKPSCVPPAVAFGDRCAVSCADLPGAHCLAGLPTADATPDVELPAGPGDGGMDAGPRDPYDSRAHGTLSGTVLGYAPQADARSIWGLLTGSRGQPLFVYVDSQPFTCETTVALPCVRPEDASAGRRAVFVYVRPSPGVYPIGDPATGGDAVSEVRVRRCASDSSWPAATSGSVTVRAADPRAGGHIDLTFDAMFGGEHLTGSLDATICH